MKLVAILCVIVYGIIFLTNMLYQSALCPNDSHDWGKIAIGAAPGAVIVALGSWLVLYASKLRIPVASLLKPYILGQPSVIKALRLSGNPQNPCCDDKIDLTTLESVWPPLKGFSYLYYLFFLIAIGVIIGQSKSAVTCLPHK
jgi:hypothetical protein